MINIVYHVSSQLLSVFLFATKQTKENHLTFFVPSENILSSFLRRMFQYLNFNTLIYIQEVFTMPDWTPVCDSTQDVKRYRYWSFFPVPNILDTDTGTFSTLLDTNCILENKYGCLYSKYKYKYGCLYSIQHLNRDVHTAYRWIFHCVLCQK